MDDGSSVWVAGVLDGNCFFKCEDYLTNYTKVITFKNMNWMLLQKPVLLLGMTSAEVHFYTASPL